MSASGDSKAMESAAASLRGRPLLVFHVNDSTDDQVLFQTACKQAKVPVSWHVVDSAEKAISYLDALVSMNRTHAVAWPDLVLLDIMMPGDSGFVVLEYIRNSPELRRLPVVVFTGSTSPEIRQHAYNLGANSYVQKPIDFSGMVDIVSSLYSHWSSTCRPLL